MELPCLPPLHPPTKPNTSFSHSSAFNLVSFVRAFGTTANYNTLPLLPASSLLIPMKANLGAILWTFLFTFCNTLELALVSMLSTNDLFLLDSTKLT
jgi:hypothetical protein